MAARTKPVIVCMLDGYGIAPDSAGNAISRASTPVMDRLIRQYPAMTLRASGLEVGLARGEMGNSEVGHLSVGTGRIFYQNRPRLDKEIQSGSFFENEELLRATAHVKKNDSTLHILGLVSRGGVHSHQEHCFALIDLAKRQGVANVRIHAILDGRDAIYNSGVGFLGELLDACEEHGIGSIASLSGRFYAMDRDNRWDRIEQAYRAMVLGEGERAADPKKAIEASYAKKVYDEEFIPTVIDKSGDPVGSIKDGDAVVFFNFRADRARELTRAFVDPSFSEFSRPLLKNIVFVTMMEYEKGLTASAAYPPEDIPTCLAKVWSEKGLRQLHIAETEKYAHVTFFFNGMREKEYPKEDRILIPSPKVSTYDLEPAMSAKKITTKLITALKKGRYDGVIVNYANPDMVGHTGKLQQTIEAVEVTDACLGELVDAVVPMGGTILITADHGNAEEVTNLTTNDIDKEHATNPVPLVIVGAAFDGKASDALRDLDWDMSLLTPVGMLSDVAPTALSIMGIPQPRAMTGQSLI
jgi:2,3-bisphosphoglycerate-independent phosphoglycerate mutase